VAEIQSINYPLHPCRLAQWPATFRTGLDRRQFVFMQRLFHTSPIFRTPHHFVAGRIARLSRHGGYFTTNRRGQYNSQLLGLPPALLEYAEETQRNSDRMLPVVMMHFLRVAPRPRR